MHYEVLSICCLSPIFIRGHWQQKSQLSCELTCVQITHHRTYTSGIDIFKRQRFMQRATSDAAKHFSDTGGKAGQRVAQCAALGGLYRHSWSFNWVFV